MSDRDPELSPAGQARREQILAFALRRVRQRRQARRAMAAAAVCMLVTGAVALLQPTIPAPAPEGSGVARITTTSDAVARIAPPPRAATSAERWEVLDDHALLAALRDAGRPATLSRIDGRTLVVFEESR